VINYQQTKKEPIELALTELKVAFEAKDFAAMDSATEKLNTVFQAASQEMYADGAEGQAEANGEQTENAQAEDVEFEEVEEEGK